MDGTQPKAPLLLHLNLRRHTAGCRHTIETQLQLTKIGDDPGKYDFADLLPEFRKKGIVTVIDADHGVI